MSEKNKLLEASKAMYKRAETAKHCAEYFCLGYASLRDYWLNRADSRKRGAIRLMKAANSL